MLQKWCWRPLEKVKEKYLNIFDHVQQQITTVHTYVYNKCPLLLCENDDKYVVCILR